MNNTLTLQVPVTAMSCASCVRRVEQALLKVPGVNSASVNLANEKADLIIEASVTSLQLVRALNKAGYPARLEQIELSVSGMSCASCITRIEKAMLATAGGALALGPGLRVAWPRVPSPSAV
jgi:copper ion binding protein